MERARRLSADSQHDGESVISAGSGAAASSGVVGVVTEGHPGPRLVFQYYETGTPDKRVPLCEKVRELARASEAGAELLRLRSSDLDPRSWFAVHWLPILCFSSTSPLIKGAFITYHRLDAGAGELALGAATALPMVGFVPYKIVDKAWYTSGEAGKPLVPVGRIASVTAWLLRIVRAAHPDFEHCGGVGAFALPSPVLAFQPSGVSPAIAATKDGLLTNINN